MISSSDQPVGPVLARLGSAGFAAAPLVPTSTGLSKSILDATAPIRELLARSGLHDFRSQLQGPEHKRELPALLVRADGTDETSVTVYRPKTKQGDPRLWIRGLPRYAVPGNLICLVAAGGELLVVNASAPDLLDIALGREGALGRRLEHRVGADPSLQALLNHLRSIAAMGWMPAGKAGPTAVGMFLEEQLGIPPNSKKGPDYLGIEVKGRRLTPSGKVAPGLQTLFAKTPAWEISAHAGGWELLEAHGYIAKDGVKRLYCTVGPTANAQGLSVVVSDASEVLHAARVMHGYPVNAASCLVWRLDDLEAMLASKHRATAWVNIESRKVGGLEEFWLRSVDFSAEPSTFLLGTLLEQGVITIDLTLRAKTTDGTGVRDHGYLFRIDRASLPALFPTPLIAYDLRVA